MNLGGKGKVQVHHAHPDLHKVACNADNKYSVKHCQALEIFTNNNWNFGKYQPPSYHDWQDPELQEAYGNTFCPVLKKH